MKLFHLPHPLAPGAMLPVPESLQHRLRHVMRMGPGDVFHAFDGTGLAGIAEIADSKCRTVTITAMLPEKPALPTRILALGVPKRDAWESALRQATEMGATTIIPLKTRFSQVGKLNTERAHLHLTEAAEQSERYTLPKLLPLMELEDYLTSLTSPCMWAFERLLHPQEGISPGSAKPTATLVGPEGGFAPEEIAQLTDHALIRPFTLGPTILRTDTAVVAALTHLAFQQ
ncbi:MAG: 16S rRNA (uracil(1498)-N(3))-methyltransferase [Alphaproteobacteria bacterium]|nr:MAG: 16S rRNA (uracil(1498)-N(3))-methyltransferase [Alphaproteobacteria bacterium]